jgi:hypothetical protein
LRNVGDGARQDNVENCDASLKLCYYDEPGLSDLAFLLEGTEGGAGIASSAKSDIANVGVYVGF